MQAAAQLGAFFRKCCGPLGERALGAARKAIKAHTDALEWFLALFALLCGVWAWADIPLFTAATKLSLVPQWAIAAVFTVHGIGCVYAMCSRSVELAKRAALANGALWLFISSFLVLSPPVTHWAVPVTLGPFLASAWVYVRLSLLFPPPKERSQ